MSDVEHLFMCLLAICMSSLEKCLFRLWPIFWSGHLFFWNWAAGAACIFLRLILCRLVCYYFLQIWGIYALIFKISFLLLTLGFFISSFSSWFRCSVQSLSCVRLFATPWIAEHQASLSITNSQSLLKLMPIESVMPSSHLILCRPLLLLPPIPPSIRASSSDSTLRMRWPKYWEFQLQHQSFHWTPKTDLL